MGCVSTPFPEATTPAASRTEVFLRYLDFFRSRLVSKLQMLPDAELRHSRLPSGWTPLELAKHLRYVELRWLEWGFEGRDVGDPWADSEGGRWHVSPDETLASLLAGLDTQAARSRAIIEAHDLDERGRTRRTLGRRRPRDARAGPVPPAAGVRQARRSPGHRHRTRHRQFRRISPIIPNGPGACPVNPGERGRPRPSAACASGRSARPRLGRRSPATRSAGRVRAPPRRCARAGS